MVHRGSCYDSIAGRDWCDSKQKQQAQLAQQYPERTAEAGSGFFVIGGPGNRRFFGYFQDIDVLREENEALKSEVEELRRKNREFAELKGRKMTS